MRKPIIVFRAPGVSLFLVASFVLSACRSDRPVENCSMAPDAYGILAEKSLQLMADFKLESWAEMMSDSVVYCFPDEGIGAPPLKGKHKLLKWWGDYTRTSGIISMKIENASYLPVHWARAPGSGLQGTQVIAYFSNRMVYGQDTVAVRMNFVIHFDQKNMIDGYYTFYDRSSILRVVKNRNPSGYL